MSSIKQLQVASDPLHGSPLLLSWLTIANVAACCCSELWAKAAEAPTPTPATAAAAAAAPPSKQAALKAAAPTLNVWLFTTGRALQEIGCLLELAPDWLAAGCRRNLGPEDLAKRFSYVSQHTEALRFLQDVLPELSAMQQEAAAGQPATAASPAPAVDAAIAQPAAAAGAGSVPVLQQLQRQVSELLDSYKPLLEQCRAAEASGDQQSLSAALDAFVAACGAGSWLTSGLQDVGAAVCAAFPQSFVCNEPSCNTMKGVTDSVKKCGACKVGTNETQYTKKYVVLCFADVRAVRRITHVAGFWRCTVAPVPAGVWCVT